MNRIILIGNGFDLAHKNATLKEEGLKTGYTDFMDNFWKNELEFVNKKEAKIISTQKEQTYSAYEDNFIIVRKDKEIKNVEELKQKVVNYKNKFLGAMVKEPRIQNWVDVEEIFYQELVKCWKIRRDNLEEDFFNSAIRKLNRDFEAIKDCLEDYLYKNCQIVVDDNTKVVDGYKFQPQMSIIDNLSEGKYDKTLFLSFNYIDTEKHYNTKEYQDNFNKAPELSFSNNVIHIHGRLKDNTMIFGYGDELAENYKDIENLNDNEFLTYIKSIRYCETNNYKNLEEFIELKDDNGDNMKFDIYIFGHSCGNCDRTLLNKLFEHPNCNKIKVFYWQRNSSTNDYDVILKNIFRNFELKNKDLFRSRVIKGEPLVDYKEPKEVTDLKKEYVLVEVEKNYKYLLREHKEEKIISGSYYISKYQVTQKLWKEIMLENRRHFNGVEKEHYPVEGVNWLDAVEFCNRLSEKYKLSKCYEIIGIEVKIIENAKGFRLPTEAEWEYAAIGGKASKKYEFSGSNELDGIGWYSQNSGGETHKVGEKQANELGIHDMSGNVWEWCEDWYDAGFSHRVLRGGSCSLNAQYCRVAFRLNASPSARSDFGFRLVLVL